MQFFYMKFNFKMYIEKIQMVFLLASIIIKDNNVFLLAKKE